MVCATSKVSDQPAHTRSLIRVIASRLNIICHGSKTVRCSSLHFLFFYLPTGLALRTLDFIRRSILCFSSASAANWSASASNSSASTLVLDPSKESVIFFSTSFLGFFTFPFNYCTLSEHVYIHYALSW